MAVEILVHAFTHSKAQKGTPQTTRPAGFQWGNKEGPPNYIFVDIPDATVAQVEQYLGNWRNEFSYELLNQNAQGRRYKISVDPRVVTVFGLTKAIAKEVRDYLVDNYGAVLVSFDASQVSAIFDIPNTDWQELKDKLLDQFELQLDPRRYRFPDATVDSAVDGRVSMNKATAIATILDKLDG